MVETPFAADDRSLGYERGSSVSRQWHAAASDASVAAASEVVDRLPLLAELKNDDSDRRQLYEDFVKRFARVAFRRR